MVERETKKHPVSNTPDTERQIEELIQEISGEAFATWYHDRQARKNIEEGKAYYNTPYFRDANRHSPHQLLQCHRKTWYEANNAPKEGTQPSGLFWIGSEFEEKIIVPFLRDIAPDRVFVQNSLWIDFEISKTVQDQDKPIRVRGSTDPAFVNEDGEPLLVTEVKTTSALEKLTDLRIHHKAQLHAYLYGLNNKYDLTVQHGVVIYNGRKTFNLKAYQISFDKEFWDERVVGWMQDQSKYRSEKQLPPGDPTFDWECGFCSFNHSITRCMSTVM